LGQLGANIKTVLPYIHRASFIIELSVPTNALRQFFHCLLYYYDAPIRISAVILPSSGGILSEFFT
jgi:hypothetical protein